MLCDKIDEKLADLCNYWLFEKRDNFCSKLKMQLIEGWFSVGSFDEEEVEDFLEELYNSISNLERLNIKEEAFFQLTVGDYQIAIFHDDYDVGIYLKQLLTDLYDYKSLEEHFKAIYGNKAETYYEYYFIDNIIDMNFSSMGYVDTRLVFGELPTEINHFNVVIY